MSSINSNNINGQYPIAAQDNDSQGFRDNFTNIKNNLAFAKTEIEELQTTAVLKAALPGATLNNDLNYAIMQEVKCLKFVDVTNSLGTTSANITLDWATAQYQSVTISANVTLDFTNWAITSGARAAILLSVTPSGNNRYITLPSAANGNSAASLSGYVVESTLHKLKLPSDGKQYLFEFSTVDQGTTVVVRDYLRSVNNSDLDFTINGLATLNSGVITSVESLNANANVSLSTVASEFSTSGPEVSILAAGTAGQIKILGMSGDLGNMTITVSNAAWGGSGTVKFDDAGDGCILQFLNSKWVCVGNNGAIFA